ncbi:MAG: hypothetical protein P8Y44_03350 [Acidobacteriota bacterium]
MTSPTDTSKPRLTRDRRGWKVARTILYVIFLITLFELTSYFGLRLFTGEFYSAARIAAEQREVAESDLRPGSSAAIEGPVYLRAEYVHPYLGFLPRFREELSLTDGLYNSQQEFYRPGSPIYDRGSDSIVIGIVGGSVANFFSREGFETLQSELADDPRFAGKKFRRAEMAHGGFKQPQQLMSLAYLLALGGSLDILINIDGFNEVVLPQTDNLPQGVSYLFPRSWYFRMPPEQLLLPSIGELAYLSRHRSLIAAAALRSPLRYFWTYRLVWKMRDRFQQSAATEIEESLREFRPTGHRAMALGPKRRFGEPSVLYATLVALWKSGSLQLERLCSANGIRYYHVLQPNQYLAGSKSFSERERRIAVRDDSRYAPIVEQAYPLLIEAGEELADSGVRFFDATRVFADVDEMVYRDPCCHYNAVGNTILGSAIAEFIRASQE